jgi:hypothetical protein
MQAIDELHHVGVGLLPERLLATTGRGS